MKKKKNTQEKRKEKVGGNLIKIKITDFHFFLFMNGKKLLRIYAKSFKKRFH